MNLEFRHTPIKCRATGATFAHTSYCRSDADAMVFARLTFNPAVFAIGGETVSPTAPIVPETVPTVPESPRTVSFQTSLF